jgi:hypothetical protein
LLVEVLRCRPHVSKYGTIILKNPSDGQNEDVLFYNFRVGHHFVMIHYSGSVLLEWNYRERERREFKLFK